MKRTILWIAVGACALAMTLTGCNKDSIEPVIPDEGGKTPVRITARMPANPVTRLAYDESDADAVKLAWTEGDAIVVSKYPNWYTFTIDPESINNEEGTATFINTGDNIWPDGEELTGRAYYPATLAGEYNSMDPGNVFLLNQVQAVDDPKAHLGPLHYMYHNFEGSITFATRQVSVLKFTFTGLGDREEVLQMKLTTPVNNYFWNNFGFSRNSRNNMSLTFEEGTTVGPEGTLTAYIMVSPNYFNNRALTVTLTTDSYERTYEATGVTITEGGFYEATIGDGDWDDTTPRSFSLFDNFVAAHATGTPITEVDNTYTITNAMELKWVVEQTNNDDWFSGKTIVLDTDIEVTADIWTPIGGINGTFDGGNHTISGELKDDATKDPGRFGFIAILGGSSIKDLNISANVTATGMNFTGEYNCGSFAGFSNGAITNCTFSGNLTMSYSGGGTVHAGGIVGSISGSSITDCQVTGTISVTNTEAVARRVVGGIVGTLTGGCTLHTSEYTGTSIEGTKAAGTTAIDGLLVGSIGVGTVYDCCTAQTSSTPWIGNPQSFTATGTCEVPEHNP